MEKSAWGVFGQKKTSRAKNLIRAQNNTSAAMLASEWLHDIKKHDLNKYQKIPSKNRAKKPIIRAKNSINRAKKPEITFCDDPVVCCAWMLFYIITMKTWQEIAEINSGKKRTSGEKHWIGQKKQPECIQSKKQPEEVLGIHILESHPLINGNHPELFLC